MVSGAQAALDGYEYQLDVSVLTALRLMLITKSASRITLEPANEEDLEADLEPATPGRVRPSANVTDGYKLVVQVKLRNSGPWSIGDFNALLKHGTARRPAKHHLDDPDTRYLLITSADVAGVARKLLVQGLEEWPEEQALPSSLSKTLPHKPGGRIAIWGVLTERLLDLEINEILGSLLRVPKSRLVVCRTRLRDEARQRMRGTSPGVWTREDLLSIVRGCGGYLASAPQLEAFVPPANYQNLSKLLERRNAIVITGPSGTGKTLTALALVDLARQRPSAPEIIQVNVSNGPASTRTLTDTGPKLFYVEDPWGQVSLRGGADAWTEQLPRLLREAHPGHQYVITSRTDMLGQAKAGEGLNPWTMVIDADQYRDGELRLIYDKRSEQLATGLQGKALDFRTGALEALETPFEIDLFFTYMADGPEPDELDPVFFRRILSLAHREAVEGVVVSYLNASDQIGSSAIIWALLAARSQFDRSQLIRLSREIRITAPNLSDELEKLLNRLVATRHLRQPGQVVSFSHPSVRLGFEIFIKQNWGRCESAFASLISALTQLGGSQREWALETAARSIKVIDDLIADSESFGLVFETDGVSRAAIDAWLEEGLVDPCSDFRSLLQLASDIGTRESIPSELARWFIHSVRRGGQVFLDNWQPPVFDDAWYAMVSADPRSFLIADRFVREQLPTDRDGFGKSFPNKLDRIATGLTPAFLAAAHKLVASGFDRNVGAVAAGAVRDLELYEAVLEAALDELKGLRRSDELESEQRRAIEDGECDEAVEEGYRFQHEDEGYAAGVFVGTYVGQVRSLGRWRSLTAHPRISELGRAWADDIALSSEPVDLEEIRAVISATKHSRNEDSAWEAARAHWQASLSSELEQRILSDPSDERLRGALAYCALVKAPTTLTSCFQRLAETPTSLVHLLVDLHAAQSRISSENRARQMRAVLAKLPDFAVEIFRALSVDDQARMAVGPAALSVLDRAAETATPAVLDEIVPIIIATGGAAATAIRRWLVETKDYQLAKAAAEAAVRIEDDALVWLALDHARADAREVALPYLAGRSPDPLPPRLLDLSNDPGSRVRRVLVRILARRPCDEHQSVLLKLIDDDWSNAEAFHNEEPSYPIAREAIDGLSAYGSLSDDIGDALLYRAERTDDRILGIAALETAARCCGPIIRKKIWALSFIEQPRWVRVDAIDALSQSDVVESEITDAITSELLMRLAPPLAASAFVLLATHGRIDAVVAAMEQVACSAKQRVLLLLGAYGLANRDHSAAARLLALLGSDHPARRLLDLTDGERLPKTVLDDLGHIRFRKAVWYWLKDKIAKD